MVGGAAEPFQWNIKLSDPKIEERDVIRPAAFHTTSKAPLYSKTGKTSVYRPSIPLGEEWMNEFLSIAVCPPPPTTVTT